MVSWSDLGASLRASPRVASRWDLWWVVAGRLFLSRVSFGYALAVLLLFLAGRILFDLTSEGQVPPLLVALLLAGPAVFCVASAFLLPWACWVLIPAASLVLPEHMALPPPQTEEEEPPFTQYLLWAVPLVAAALLLAGLSFVPALGHGWAGWGFAFACSAILGLAALTLFTRTALAAHYEGEEIRAFLRVTRRPRRFVVLPVVLLLGWGIWAALQLANRLLPDPPALAWVALDLLLAVLGLLAAFTFTGAVLRAAGRLQDSETETSSSANSTQVTALDEGPRFALPTRPMVLPRRHPPALRAPGRRLRWLGSTLRITGVFAAIAGVAYLARLPLADWYLSHDPGYVAATDTLDRLHGNAGHRYGPILDANVLEQRLRAGYIVAGCNGDLERAGWLERLGVPQEVDQMRLLACAACAYQKDAVAWVLQTQPALRPGLVVLATHGDRRKPRSALSCAARDNDLALARQLLARGARVRDLAGPYSAVAVAATQQNWEMVALLLHKDPAAADAATFAGLDAAYARDPNRPAEVLPRLLAPGSDLRAVDRQGRNLFHWAAMRHDLRTARLLVERGQPDAVQQALLRPDRQGALPWMYVLRKAELDAQPLSANATELLRLLLPPAADVNQQLQPPLEAGAGDAFPAGWSAGAASLNQPAARAVLGPDLDFGLLPQDPARWWNFTSATQAEEFVRGLTLVQLERAEHPQAPAGLEPRKLSDALAEAGWTDLATLVRKALQGQRAAPARRAEPPQSRS